MEFSGNQPIYLQIADYICEKILSKEWKEGDRIPSVREMAVIIEVNPNTVMRSVTLLQEKDIISNQRGVGFFVSENGFENAMTYMSGHFINTDLNNLFKKMDLLNISLPKLKEYYTKYKSDK